MVVLGQTSFDWNYLLTAGMVMLFLVACVLLTLTVLIQKPQGGGLAGAFGSGAGSGQTAFGTRTGDALTVATIIMFTLYLGTAVGLTYLIKPGASTAASTVTAPAGGATPPTTAPSETPAPAGNQSPPAPAPSAAAPADGANAASQAPGANPTSGPEAPAAPATPPAETPKP
ncbi:MAG: preprotein translocase subunit SecG [Phycisphaerales bacterium]